MFCFHTMAFKLRLNKYPKFIFEHNLEPQSREKLKVLSIHRSYLIPSFLFLICSKLYTKQIQNYEPCIKCSTVLKDLNYIILPLLHMIDSVK